MAKTGFILAVGCTGILWAMAGQAAPVGNPAYLAGALPSISLPGLPKVKLPKAAKASSNPTGDRKEQRRLGDLVKAVLADIENFRPDHRTFLANNDKAQEDAARALEDFRVKMGRAITPDLVAMANDGSNSYTVRAAKIADNLANMTARLIEATDLDKFRNSDGRDDLAMAQYFVMAYREEQMKQLAALYPHRESIVAANQIASDAMTELGSLASVKQGREAAQAARIAAMRLYPAVRRDPATESDLAAAFKASIWTQGEFAGSEILKVNLISQGWTVRRNPVTGIILSRDQRADIAVRRRDGKCFSYVVEFEQKHQGSGYGGTYMASGRDLEMLCENISG